MVYCFDDGWRFKDHAGLWSQWAAVSLADLSASPAALLQVLPQGKAESGPAPDVGWLLDRLEKSEAIRINWGSEDFQAPDGRFFSRDRFFLGGRVSKQHAGDIAATDLDPLYQTGRSFPFLSRAGYDIPLPPGRYRIALHFAETSMKKTGERRFGATIEGKWIFKTHEPLQTGFATAASKTVTTAVLDGLFNLEFHFEISSPKVSTIEIEKLE